MFEYVLRRPDGPDEVLISEHDSVPVGGTIVIRERTWIVVAIEPSETPGVEERRILEPQK
jgi:hypothetical protein